jgi:hypothetical protein
VAQNAILVDGQGQINRKATANGHIVAFESTPHIGYVCGDAAAAYGDRLTRFHRHVVLVRPSLVCIVDDLQSPEPATFQWLMHAPEELELNEAGQTFVSQRGDAEMEVHLVTPGGFGFSQTNDWPLDPKTGFPTASKPEPTKLWHFAAATQQQASTRRIAAVMNVGTKAERPECSVRVEGDVVRVETKAGGGETVVEIDLSPDRPKDEALMTVRCKPKQGEAEILAVQ